MHILYYLILLWSYKAETCYPRSWLTQYQGSIAPRTISEWNSLTDTVTSAGSVLLFRIQLSVLNSMRALTIAVIFCKGVSDYYPDPESCHQIAPPPPSVTFAVFLLSCGIPCRNFYSSSEVAIIRLFIMSFEF